MRTREHYENMLKDNPGTTWGLSLAAQAVYAAKKGMFNRNADDYDHEAYRATYLRLQDKYGEMLNPDDVRSEMDIVRTMSALGSRTSPDKADASRANGRKGGRPKGSGCLTPLQKQVYDLRKSGFTVKQIAEELSRRPENIRQALARVATKLQIPGGWTGIEEG